MTSILLTGFEPFGGDALNPSWEIARALDGHCLAGARVHACCLPTRFASAPEAVNAALLAYRPALVLALGLAAGRTEISMERVAVNLIDARIPDNDGLQPHDQPVRPGAPPAYFSTLPLKPMLAGLRAAGLPAALSMSAGAFVCNQVFFELQHGCAPLAVPSGFIHVPQLPQQAAQAGGPSMALATQIEAIALALNIAFNLRQQGGSLTFDAAQDTGSPVA